MGKSYAWQVVQNRKILRIDNLIDNPGKLNGSPLRESEGFVSYIGAPLIAKGVVKGVLEIFQREPIPS